MLTLEDLFVVAVVWGTVIVLSWFLSSYLLGVFTGRKSRLDRILVPVENFIYLLAGIDSSKNMGWKEYFKALLYLNAGEAILAFFILMFQQSLPLNPMHYSGMSWSLALNTVLSFSSNTNLQHYNGELTLSYLSQMSAIQFLQFTSAATGLAVGVAVIRGFAGKARTIGNFYYDYVRSLTRVLLPLAFIATIILIFMGVPQALSGYPTVSTLQKGATEILYKGPIASLVSIMQLGTNGGGYFGANSAYPLQNPSQLSDLFEIGMMMFIPTSLLFLFGRMVGDNREGRTLFLAAYAIYGIDLLIAFLSTTVIGRGLEVRIGGVASTLWTVTTTAFTTGSLNASLSGFNPVVILTAFFGMLIQAAPGGVGVGAMYLIMYVIVTIFLVGLMAGRTPEYLGVKIEGSDVKLAVAAFLTHPIIILVPTVVAFAIGAESTVGLAANATGFTRIFYEFTSAAANNGSDYLGAAGNTVFFNVATGIVMWVGRFLPILFMLAIADGVSTRKRSQKQGLKTGSISFVVILVFSIFILTVLTFFPFLVLGPVLQFLQGMRLSIGGVIFGL
ncbi:MAG: potassium-transporting ATPase subunit KdpA [Candidatus Thermoplasmatota archaeon]|jgi:K+-transporting ATPase ATPase A chain|nr:potassium-transporting ATPase subunit KdpA [Candidatus Thermoplasmatota archaeon]MCL5930566.1 potassium-transporting ATPase subunit KdpA [Candidatus Thermoplasmatota archaeon]